MFFMIPALVTPNHASEGLIVRSELIIFYEKLDWFIKFLIGLLNFLLEL